MNEDQDHSNTVSLRDYIDTRLAALDRATILALETVKVAMERTDQGRNTWIAILALLVSTATLVYMIAKHT